MSGSAVRAAGLLERLLVDPALRAEYRRAPAATLERHGLRELAADVAAPPPQVLERRESRSSLAGMLMAAAVEGAGMLDLARRPAALEPDAEAALRRAMTRPAVRRLSTVTPAIAEPPAAPRTGVVSVARTLPDGADVPNGDTPPRGYPGDDASKEAIAAWMGAAARRAGLPPELPVMAALQESTLANVDHGDADSLGYFQMRVSVWDTGAYAGYAERPELQLRWFLDRAVAERVKHPELAASPETWGTWIANVERPAEANRGLYAQHLAEARRLLAPDAHVADRTPARPAARTISAASLREPARTGRHPVLRQVAGAAHPDAGVRLPQRILAVAEREIGRREAPLGSNDSDRIARYREATPGGTVGPWCAYFVSWVAKESGAPLGDRAQGFAAVDDLWDWAETSGRAIPSGATPRPGDLIVWDEHVGVVERVADDGTIHTIEGNTSDQVARRQYTPPAGIVGFVRLTRPSE